MTIPISSIISTLVVAFAPLLFVFVLPRLARTVGLFLGWTLKKKTEGRRAHIVAIMDQESRKSRPSSATSSEKSAAAGLETKSTSSGEWQNVQDPSDKLWDGIVGFFHPFCNAGGGGERVLWAAIRATQDRWPNAKCVVYTGDHDVTKDQILSLVKSRFNIELHAPNITFLYLSKRHWVLASTWPHFTLLGQSLGSIVLAWDAFKLLVPDIFIDTMGYAFSLGFSKFLFPGVPTGAYVHYPTISTDMLDSLDPDSELGTRGVNGGQGVGVRGLAKKVYWKLFARVYSWVGSSIDVVMANSTWTRTHIRALWGPFRGDKDKDHPITAVYPPCAVRELEDEVPVSEATEALRGKVLVYIAQFRPEKNHQLIIESFAKFVRTESDAARDAKLVLIGSVRDDADSKRVYELRLLVNELRIKDHVIFHLDAPWPDVLDWLRRASVGVNGMWNEHFGIGVVEYQAAGLVCVVHNSGGPKLDIAVEIDGQPTGELCYLLSSSTSLPPSSPLILLTPSSLGFHATTVDEFAECYEKALSLKDPLAWRLRARKSALRFTEEEFAREWLAQAERLVALTK
ncbi:alpha-1,2-mannosyltransferase [Geosmithia morbida]|uniref:GDP-Man:Man(3)GlcNAc(2)-PP-Dol alpha-1,2-mannosyltransferase n=1 Tax=Geosmithia morbida TaxID=1094350 RepID=A0A9P5D6S2_9HYPO|nr:alpha-1,2-mannosyltransferase [Geosmithia morbida]KAF4125881.1 alpha-1,2-mannosyltransferase [Geosmithia morbida]